MARSFIVYQGEDELPEYDLTEPSSDVHVIWEEIEAGGRAFNGESTTNSIPIRDEQAETGNQQDLPSGMELTSLSRGSRWEWLENVGEANEVRMAAGRIGTKDYSRGRQKADRAREVVVQAADRNEELTEIIVDDWVRPEETDVARALALCAAYLNGSPRSTTVLATTYVAAGNTVTMPAKTYDGTNPKDIFNELALQANKLFFVTVDDEVFYDTADSTAYQAGLRISDRIDELSTAGGCGEGSTGSIGSAATLDPLNYDAQVVTGPRAERVQMTTTQAATSGQAVVVLTTNRGASEAAGGPATGVYDSEGNTYTRIAESTFLSGAYKARPAIWYSNLTTDLPAGSTIGYEVDVGSSLVASLETGGKAISAMAFDSFVTSASGSGSGGAFGSSPAVTVGAGDIEVACIAWFGGASGFPDTFTPDGDWTPFTEAVTTTDAADCQQLEGGYILAGPGDTYNGTIDQSRDWATVGAVLTLGTGSEGLPTFPPIWDVGPSSTEDGLELVSGLRLYYGQDGAYVYVNHTDTANEYWWAERSFYTQDPAIDDSTKATALANAILTRLRFEERTYNLSIGPLNENQVGCIKYGQLINVKARAIPDADDQFRQRRIAQLKWTTPRPGVFFARMQLNRPIKQLPYGIGAKEGHDAIEQHKEGDSHPASAIVVTPFDTIAATDVQAALEEIFAEAGGAAALPWFDVTTYGATGDGVTDDTTDINSAIAALNSAGRGVLYFPAGNYLVSAALTAITAVCTIRGDGPGGGGRDMTTYVSRITCSDGGVTVFNIQSHAYTVEALHLECSDSTPTAGGAIAITANGDHGRFLHVSIDGFYIGIDIQEGAEWSMSDCHIQSPALYGIKIRHVDLPDGGDWSISNTQIIANDRTATAAIRQESGGGGKITNVKINGSSGETFTDGIQAVFTNLNTTILMLSNVSIENVTGDAVDISTAGTATFGQIVIDGLQVGLYSNNTGRAVKIAAASAGGHGVAGGLSGVSIDGLVAMTDGTARAAVELTNLDVVTLGGITLLGFNARYTGSGNTNVTDSGAGVVEFDDLSDVTITSVAEGDEPRWNGTAWVNTGPLICVDPGSITVDDTGPFGITLTSVWGVDDDDGQPYYDDANATAGEEAALFYDPLNDAYCLVTYDFP